MEPYFVVALKCVSNEKKTVKKMICTGVTVSFIE